VAETTDKTLLYCGFRRTGKVRGQVYPCWWGICREIDVYFPFRISLCFAFYVQLWPIYWLSFANAPSFYEGCICRQNIQCYHVLYRTITGSTGEVKEAWIYISTSQYVLTVWCLIKNKENFIILCVSNYIIITSSDKNRKSWSCFIPYNNCISWVAENIY
jgi:hypothetical protein